MKWMSYCEEEKEARKPQKKSSALQESATLHTLKLRLTEMDKSSSTDSNISLQRQPKLVKIFYWLQMHRNETKIVKRCVLCSTTKLKNSKTKFIVTTSNTLDTIGATSIHFWE
ncbi:hypothetical protein HPP92_001472 [Vanilla planifolia]|uniref:Uncharacterized protein n=1 Tax=Vanilla planifolia TaxID=51239 RepID=A0A835RUC6_VANPL|nr:hypothetical protein HPP92_001639 [Vanilla planifolia]KAG0501400.1 hypothetical protein HPP92_001472 [Vanilla planifolia]